MQDVPSSQGVSRLKELLFEPESQAIGELRQRIEQLADTDKRIHQDLLDRLAQIVASIEARTDALAAADEREARERQEMLRSISPLLERSGTEERFRRSVANALDGALREAEVSRHQELASAIAPLVVRTIKTEIRGSQDEIADALFPHIGRMVKSYVLSAMKDLSDQLNRRLERNPIVLRIRSWTLGRPVSELLMAEAMRLDVEELYLIRRGTGELLARWPQLGGGANRDHVLGGTLSAISEFASDAFQDESTSLRHIDLGTSQIYLRASPLHLLAAKCTGTAPAAIEQVVDECFLEGAGKHGLATSSDVLATAAGSALLGELAETLRTRVAARQEQLAVPPLGFGPLKWAAALLLVPLIAVMGWLVYVDLVTARTRSIAESAVLDVAELNGYPTRIEVERGGRVLTLTGLSPSMNAKTVTANRLAAALPAVEVRERLVVLPNNAAEAERLVVELKRDVSGIERNIRDIASEANGVRRDLTGMENELAATGLRRTLQRASIRLEQISPDLARLEAELKEPGERDTVRRLASSVAELQQGLRSRQSMLTGQDARAGADGMLRVLKEWRRALSSTNEGLAALVDPNAQQKAKPVLSEQGNAGDLAEDIAAAVERTAALAAAALQTNALRLSMPSGPTPREQLDAFIREHAIFFANGTDFRSEAAANDVLDRLGALVRQSGVVLRVVGYTDERGGQQRNESLSQQRADKVVEALIQRGVPRERLVSIGRLNSIDLSPASGVNSPNRRVQFEIGYAEEQAP